MPRDTPVFASVFFQGAFKVQFPGARGDDDGTVGYLPELAGTVPDMAPEIPDMPIDAEYVRFLDDMDVGMGFHLADQFFQDN